MVYYTENNWYFIYSIIQLCYFLNDNDIIILIDKIIQYFVYFIWDLFGPLNKDI